MDPTDICDMQIDNYDQWLWNRRRKGNIPEMNPLTIINVTGYIDILSAILRNWSSKSFNFPLAWLRVFEMNIALEVARLKRKIELIVYLVSTPSRPSEKETNQGNGYGWNNTGEKLPEILPISLLSQVKSDSNIPGRVWGKEIVEIQSLLYQFHRPFRNMTRTSCDPTVCQLSAYRSMQKENVPSIQDLIMSKMPKCSRDERYKESQSDRSANIIPLQFCPSTAFSPLWFKFTHFSRWGWLRNRWLTSNWWLYMYTSSWPFFISPLTT